MVCQEFKGQRNDSGIYVYIRNLPARWVKTSDVMKYQHQLTMPMEGPRPPVISIWWCFMMYTSSSFQSYPSGMAMVMLTEPHFLQMSPMPSTG
ncbi:hypothetical protein INR49_012983 [Caranx melampygus]|nr:hypothetical protein INR49_012983 [Caranx melampygus]